MTPVLTSEKPVQVVFKGPALDFLEKEVKASGTNTSGFIREVLQIYATLKKYKDPTDNTITIETTDGKKFKLIMPHQLKPD
ncbi:MAG: hypothetical protein ABSD99_00095 [Candidatus Bathyarchaeia archaeon]|jgi:hypothetical protein